MSAHGKTPQTTPSMDFPSGKGVVWGRRGQQLGFALPVLGAKNEVDLRHTPAAAVVEVRDGEPAVGRDRGTTGERVVRPEAVCNSCPRRFKRGHVRSYAGVGCERPCGAQRCCDCGCDEGMAHPHASGVGGADPHRRNVEADTRAWRQRWLAPHGVCCPVQLRAHAILSASQTILSFKLAQI